MKAENRLRDNVRRTTKQVLLSSRPGKDHPFDRTLIEPLMISQYAEEPYLWQSVYRLALAMQTDPATRSELLLHAATAILQRAYALEVGTGSDSECAALKDASKRLRRMKREMQGERVARPENR